MLIRNPSFRLRAALVASLVVIDCSGLHEDPPPRDESDGGAAGVSGSGGEGKTECSEPTLEQCKDTTWLDTDECGKAALEAMRTDSEATCNKLLAQWAQQSTEDIEAEQVVLPDDLDGGLVMAKVVPNPDEGLSDVDMPLTRAENAQKAAIGATESGLSAEEQALRDRWEANGNRVESCREYVHEKYYDYARFEDAVVARHDDFSYVAEVAFGDAADSTAIATRAANGQRLKMRDGNAMDWTIQGLKIGFKIAVAPDNDCISEWTTRKLQNAFAAMPNDLIDEELLGELNLRDQRCFVFGLEDDPGYPENQWRWHLNRRSRALEAGHAPVLLDARYKNVREFQQAMFDYMENRTVTPTCCPASPVSNEQIECCNSHQAERTSLETRLKELFAKAHKAGCVPEASSGDATLCDWSPAYFVEQLRSSFGSAMEADYQRCLELTADDFDALKSYTFHLPNGDEWPDSLSCGRYGSLWGKMTCPVDDYTVSAADIDRFFARYEEFEEAVTAYWQEVRASMPKSLFDSEGHLKPPGGQWGDHHEAGNAKFGVGYDYSLAWGLDGVTSTKEPNVDTLCGKGPQIKGSFTAWGRAFGERVDAVDAAFDADMENIIDAHLIVLGNSVWSPKSLEDLADRSSFSISRNVIPPPPADKQDAKCKDDRRACVKVRFSIVGIPMSVSGAVAGSLSLALPYTYEGSSESAGVKTCWRATAKFEPGLALDAYAALAVDMKIASAGVRCDLTLLGLSLPVTWELTETIPQPNTLKLAINSGATLDVNALKGKIAAFVSVDLGLFDATYSYNLFNWDGITLASVPIFGEPVFDVSLTDLVILMAMEEAGEI